MRNIRLLIEYDGTNFSGWEIQPRRRTIRGEIERKLSSLLQEDVKLIGGARTDAGVHAICQVANFKTTTELSLFKIRRALLGLPSDIYVKDVVPVPSEFDARIDASSRVYLYKLLLGKSPLLRTRVWEYKFRLEIKKIEEALSLFLGTHRFDLFSYRDSGECEVKRLELTNHTPRHPDPFRLGTGRRDYSITNPWSMGVRTDVPTCSATHGSAPTLVVGAIRLRRMPLQVVFEIEANRFLRRMVRMIIGALTELGRGKIKEEDIRLALELKGKKSFCAPACGLYLKEVKYR